MRHKITFLVLAFSLAGGTPASAQQAEWVRQLLIASQLPLVTLEARREGVPNDEIRSVLDAVRRAGVPAFEATALIDTARVVRRDHGPVDNFGAFVQTQLAAGKRGRELAAAIRAEHARVGKGPGTKASGPGRGNAGAKGSARGAERDDTLRTRGTPAGRAKADTARARGRSDAQGPGRSGNRPGASGNTPRNPNDPPGKARPNTPNR